MWSALVEENLAQRGAQATGFDIGQAGEIATGELDLNQVGSPSPQVQCCWLPLAVSADDPKVMPAQSSQ
ncbi:MAG: hypothetical protein JWQ81_975 [Amycolatopsis sp.]|nr:hypothetical protein [Amycolatopsis sp.]